MWHSLASNTFNTQGFLPLAMALPQLGSLEKMWYDRALPPFPPPSLTHKNNHIHTRQHVYKHAHKQKSKRTHRTHMAGLCLYVSCRVRCRLGPNHNLGDEGLNVIANIIGSCASLNSLQYARRLVCLWPPCVSAYADACGGSVDDIKATDAGATALHAAIASCPSLTKITYAPRTHIHTHDCACACVRAQAPPLTLNPVSRTLRDKRRTWSVLAQAQAERYFTGHSARHPSRGGQVQAARAAGTRYTRRAHVCANAVANAVVCSQGEARGTAQEAQALRWTRARRARPAPTLRGRCLSSL
jgi:hypothetical protein